MSFLNKAILLTKEGGYVAMLVPTTWAAGAKNPHTNENIFQDIIKTKKIININMDEGKFFNVGIGISSLVYQNNDLKQNTIKLQGKDFEISEYSMLPKNVDDITLSIFNKIRNFQKMKFEFVRKSFKNDELSNLQTQEYPNPTYVGKNGIKYVNSFTKFDDMPKLLVHRMSFGSGGIQVLLDNEGTVTPNYSNVYLLDGNDNGQYFDSVHGHPDIIPQKLTKDHLQSIKDYTHTSSDDPDGDGSSKNINSYLRNRLSNDPNPPHKVMHQNPDDVEFRTKQLTSVFTPENTNRKPVQVFSGIPPSIGKQLTDSKPGTKHTLAGATSTSTSRDTARGYGIDHARNERANIDHPHMLVCHVEPGAGLSLAHHSRFEENEMLLHPGAHVTYRGSEVTDDGEHLHHVTVHNTHKPLDEYPDYKG
jgi:hypothetical protein